MVIGINGYEAVIPRFGFDRKTGLPNRVGSGEIAFETLRELYFLDKKNDYRIYLPTEKTSDLPQERSGWNYIRAEGRTLWTMIPLSKKLFADRGRIDVFYSSTHYLPLYIGCPSVVTILDLSYVHFPDLFKRKDLYQLKLWGRYSVNKAAKIITISESSKNDIIRHYKVPEEKIKVVYPGIKSKSQMSNVKTASQPRLNRGQNLNLLKDKYNVQGDYILFVGTLQPRKNVSRLIEALSKIKDKNINVIVIGKKGWMFEEIFKAPQKFGVGDRVKFLDSVPDEDLPSFYANAACFVLPSLYEGFGLPVLEAMQYGCPVITSNVSSLPEAGGDAAIYVDPQSAADISEKIERVLGSESLRNEMREKGFLQAKKFSWEKTAKETLKVLEALGRKEK